MSTVLLQLGGQALSFYGREKNPRNRSCPGVNKHPFVNKTQYRLTECQRPVIPHETPYLNPKHFTKLCNALRKKEQKKSLKEAMIPSYLLLH